MDERECSGTLRAYLTLNVVTLTNAGKKSSGVFTGASGLSELPPLRLGDAAGTSGLTPRGRRRGVRYDFD